MKKTISIFAILAFTVALFAQESTKPIETGTITYKSTLKLDIKIEGNEALSKLLPKEQVSQKVLYFDKNASLYKNAERGENDEAEMETGAMTVKMSTNEDVYYVDFQKKKTIEQRDFMTRIFLIENEFDRKGWKLTTDQKEILGYLCQKATKTDGDKEIIAWFAPQIPIPTGPKDICGLPGLVLEASINDGQTTIIATHIDSNPVEKSLLRKPKKGKKVTDEEFKKIVKEKIKEMGGNQAAGNKVISIKIGD